MKKLKKYGWGLIIAVILVMIIIPVMIHFLSPSTTSEITADGLLGYLGNCAASIPTIIIAAVAIWQTSKANKLAEQANEGAIKSDEIAQNANDISKELLELTKEANRNTDIANDLSRSANQISEKALVLTGEANNRAEKANALTEEANKVSKKLLELEEVRQRLELRPCFAIINWNAPLKNLNEIVMNSEGLCIQVGPYSDGVAWGIELELLNTSAGFETICYNEAVDECGNTIWSNSMIGMKTRKIGLPSLDVAKVYFYADEEFWKKQDHKKIIVDFFVNNRLDQPYREKFELLIMSMTDAVVHKNKEVYLHLEIQNYNVGKYVGLSEKYPDGIAWEK